MVEMIQRIFRSFEHNNHGALYPPPEGTGFTARVIIRQTLILRKGEGVGGSHLQQEIIGNTIQRTTYEHQGN